MLHIHMCCVFAYSDTATQEKQTEERRDIRRFLKQKGKAPWDLELMKEDIEYDAACLSRTMRAIPRFSATLHHTQTRRHTSPHTHTHTTCRVYDE